MLLFDGAHSQSVVADHRVVSRSYIGLRASGALILQRVLPEKKIEGFPPAVE